jgi:hypothetical protein
VQLPATGAGKHFAGCLPGPEQRAAEYGGKIFSAQGPACALCFLSALRVKPKAGQPSVKYRPWIVHMAVPHKGYSYSFFHAPRPPQKIPETNTFVSRTIFTTNLFYRF